MYRDMRREAGVGSTGLIFILVFFILIIIPCAGIIWIGTKLLNKLGRYPSKTPAIQLSIIWPLIIIEVVSFTLLVGFFKILVAE